MKNKISAALLTRVKYFMRRHMLMSYNQVTWREREQRQAFRKGVSYHAITDLTGLNLPIINSVEAMRLRTMEELDTVVVASAHYDRLHIRMEVTYR
ncbi:hypothetical protein NPIL_544811 [Nephila pilipes]|uniref:Uncharacterized protein n=1 Tax=Nephila pilipes TaxID=299642 RepID=A0A8X6TW88_NEPPI|nr:hypothetical protein NPIL_544811 [Nephila pilipes]